MAEVETNPMTRPRPKVAISNTAANMISSLHGRGRTKIDAVIADIKSDIEDPAKINRVSGYDNVFVARGHGMRIIFSREGDTLVVTAVSAES